MRAKNRNAMRKQLSNWFLAASLAVTGARLLDLFSNVSRFDQLIAFVFIVLGICALLVSLVLLYYMEGEE